MGECRYWKQGRCKFGDDCRYEHIGPPGGGGSGGGGRGGGGNNDNGHYKSYNNNHNNNSRHRNNYNNNHDDSEARPTWPLSVIGLPNLSQGNLLDDDISPEELRVNAYMQAPPRGKSDAVSASEQNLVQEYKAKEARARGSNPSMQQSNSRQPQAIATQDPFASNGNNNGGGGGNGYNNNNGMNDVRQQPSDPFSNSQPSYNQNQQQQDPFGNGASLGHNNSSSFGAPTSTPISLPSIHTPFNTTPQQPAATPFAMPMATPTLTPKVEANLSQKDVAAFNAQSFGFDPVPEVAPPARFC